MQFSRYLVATIVTWLVSTGALACSPLISESFAIPHARTAARPLATPLVTVRTLIAGLPALEPGDSCEGTAILILQVKLPAGSSVPVRRLGFAIHQVSGTPAPGLMPKEALIARRTDKGEYQLHYAWTALPRDPDGHVRWNLEVTALTRDGRRSPPVPLRVASD